MKRLFTSLIVPAALVAAISLPASAAAPSVTPDQQLVAGIEQARIAARATLQGTPRLRELIAGMGSAQKAAPGAVGALESRTMRAALSQGKALARQAQEAFVRDDPASARPKLRRLIALTSAALEDFGMPLEKEFAAFAVNRDFAHIPDFTNYSGVSATVGEDISEVVIGAADRTTANVGVPGITTGESVGLPITARSAYIVSDPSGSFTTGWCTLDAGLITCRIRPAMPAENIFTIAFGPKLPDGTRLLVKFRSESGERSYAVFSTR